MENQSRNQSPGRQRGNRRGGRGRSRNRQSNQQQPQGKSSGGGSNSRNRNRRGGGSRPQAKKVSLIGRILSALTFGLLGRKGQPKPSGSRNRTERPAPSRTEKPAPAPASADTGRAKRARAEVTSGRLYVGNLDYSTGESELEDLFRGVGNVISTEVVTNPRTQQSKGFAFVEMNTVEEARRAVSILDDQEFKGRRLVVSGARNDLDEGEPGEESLADSAAGSRG